MFFVTTNIINGEYAYTSLTVILWSISLMIAFLNTNFSKYKKAINRMAIMLIPVYALHYSYPLYSASIGCFLWLLGTISRICNCSFHNINFSLYYNKDFIYEDLLQNLKLQNNDKTYNKNH